MFTLIFLISQKTTKKLMYENIFMVFMLKLFEVPSQNVQILTKISLNELSMEK